MSKRTTFRFAVDAGSRRSAVWLVGFRTLAPSDPFVVGANDFKRLVGIRNAIAHREPATDDDGGQRIFRDGVAWTIDSLNDESDEFTNCQVRLNDILYGYLGHPKR